jgi:TetR/AcrR family transcriptional regulator, transcriptional repressor of aconitase
MPKLSQTDLDARRRQIREAANRCFARKGVQATTMREIFAEAGLSAGAVYNYFKTKEELIEAGIIESTRENIDTIVEAAETMTFREIIELFLADLEASAHDGRAKATPMIHAEVAIRPDLLRSSRRAGTTCAAPPASRSPACAPTSRPPSTPPSSTSSSPSTRGS